MNKTAISWKNPKEGWKLDYTLNPIIGCKNSCKNNEGKLYCYARRMNDRFKWIPEWTEPVFYLERLYEIYKIKEPATWFLGSVSDIFGEWIPKSWIDKIIYVASFNRRHRFMFLTKNPKRYREFAFSNNCWLGTTVDHVKNKDRVIQLDKYKYLNKKFVSIEPLLSDMGEVDFSGINLCIVGADSSPGAKPPQKSWINSISHENIYFKPNIRKYL